MKSYSQSPNFFALRCLFWVLRGFKILKNLGTPETLKRYISVCTNNIIILLIAIFIAIFRIYQKNLMEKVLDKKIHCSGVFQPMRPFWVPLGTYVAILGTPRFVVH